MKPHRHCLALIALLAGGLTMAGCSSSPSTRPGGTQAASGAPATAAGATAAGKPKAAVSGKPAGKPLPANTGIPACDDYLSSYVACHRAAAVYAPDQIQSHYESMRDSLLRDSQDPNVRPQLGARCTSLALQLRQALHGKSCAPISPATTSSAAGSR
ncbi:hypothetical protein [Dyella sp. 20L07]|uniref:hypothetical protein n=1 Tax=Dyella sp. 20L07 TaxID=3384240 RepID=UPI003D283439